MESCLNCRFRAGLSGTDLIIGDFWGMENTDVPFKDDMGTSVVLVYSEKGKQLLDEADTVKWQVTYDAVLAGNPFLEKTPKVDAALRTRMERMTTNTIF